MSSFDRFRTPGGDLAAFFRSIVTPSHRYSSSQGNESASLQQGDYEWEQLRANQAAAKHLDFFAHGLAGPRGAEVVLQALRASPGATCISLVSSPRLKRPSSPPTRLRCTESERSGRQWPACSTRGIETATSERHWRQPSGALPWLHLLQAELTTLATGAQLVWKSSDRRLHAPHRSPVCISAALAGRPELS